jgi:biotin-dependent carboxylase-like uncharacterized protein
MSVRVLKAGLLTTVQDRGRHGLRHLGVGPGGAMDPVAFELANALAGNRGDEAALEITLAGPELLFEEEALVALCGARIERLPCDRPFLAGAGTRLAIGRAASGSRAYLAVAGGIAVAPVLGSRATSLAGRFGGLEGRALRAGDVLPLSEGSSLEAKAKFEKLAPRATVRGELRTVRWSAPALTLPERGPLTVHAMPGRHWPLFDAASRRAFFESEWRVSPDSNRMGYRLVGPRLARERGGELLSEPTCLGTVQVPADGTPIALMADHQTTGGYPKIAEIAGADAARLAQLAPGGTLRFARCTLEQARELRRAARERLEAAKQAIALEYGT